MNDLERARALLDRPECTFAAVRDGREITSCERGIRPLLDLIEREISLAGWSVADKVVGRAPAKLYTILEPEEIYSHVMTADADGILEEAGIRHCFDVMTDKILNRAETDICPMEKAAAGIDDPYEVLAAVKTRLAEISRLGTGPNRHVS